MEPDPSHSTTLVQQLRVLNCPRHCISYAEALRNNLALQGRSPPTLPAFKVRMIGSGWWASASWLVEGASAPKESRLFCTTCPEKVICPDTLIYSTNLTDVDLHILCDMIRSHEH